MKKKILIITIFLLIMIGIIIFAIIKNHSPETNPTNEILEYTPQEEISDEQLRETILTLYFLDPSTNTLKSEGKIIDSSQLLKDPYKIIVQYLIDGPKSQTLQSVFPENTRIIDTTLENNCVTLNFSEELLNYKDDTEKYNIINSILNSLSQLTEINSIKITINGKSHEGIDKEYTALY